MEQFVEKNKAYFISLIINLIAGLLVGFILLFGINNPGFILSFSFGFLFGAVNLLVFYFGYLKNIKNSAVRYVISNGIRLLFICICLGLNVLILHNLNLNMLYILVDVIEITLVYAFMVIIEINKKKE